MLKKTKKLAEKVKKAIAKRKIVRIINPHKIKSKPIKIKNFLKGDFKKIKKVALDMQMLAFNAEKEGLFENVYAVAHAEISRKPMAFFILNSENKKMGGKFRDFLIEYGQIIINPEIVPGKHSGSKQGMMEGCLSFPGKQMTLVRRYYKATIKFNYLTFNDDKVGDINGIAEAEVDMKGFLAQLFQHEIDHINGINIYD